MSRYVTSERVPVDVVVIEGGGRVQTDRQNRAKGRQVLRKG